MAHNKAATSWRPRRCARDRLCRRRLRYASGLTAGGPQQSGCAAQPECYGHVHVPGGKGGGRTPRLGGKACDRPKTRPLRPVGGALTVAQQSGRVKVQPALVCSTERKSAASNPTAIRSKHRGRPAGATHQGLGNRPSLRAKPRSKPLSTPANRSLLAERVQSLGAAAP